MKRTISILFLFLLTPSLVKAVVTITIPKSGTNLLLKCLKSIQGKKSFNNIAAFIHGNHVYDEDSVYWIHHWKMPLDEYKYLGPTKNKIDFFKGNNIKIVLILRDPRQHIIALLRSIKKTINPKNIEFGIRNFPKLLYDQSVFNDTFDYKDINACYEDYLKWRDEYPNVHLVRFENLVGEKGGGDAISQYEEVVGLMEFLNKEAKIESAQEIANQLFGGTKTFKVGKIDSWKQYYSDKNKETFKEVAGDLLIKLGYEKDYNW